MIKEVLKRIATAGLRINMLKKEVQFLGHIIGSEGIKTDPRKVEAIKTSKDQNV